LKKRLTKELVLVALNMRMKVDASDYVMSNILSIECKDMWWRPVAFLSKSLNETREITRYIIKRY